MKDIKCPVCGKVGIKDYHNEDIICPCCGSDLSIFRVIDKVPEKKRNHSVLWIIIASISFVSAIIIASMYVNQAKTLHQTANILIQKADSVSTLKQTVHSLEQELKEIPQPQVYYKHIVRTGDNLWKISYRYFNTGTRYHDIAKWNDIEVDAVISVGDTLIIR